MDLLKINLEDVVTFHSGEQDNLEIIINKTKSKDWEDIKNQ
jgi:hypothetical protein